VRYGILTRAKKIRGGFAPRLVTLKLGQDFLACHQQMAGWVE
jgi:hypothetical protein